MEQLEKVEKLRQRANVSYEEAKEALRKFDEACGNRPAAEPKDGSEKSEKKKKSFMDKIKETFED